MRAAKKSYRSSGSSALTRISLERAIHLNAYTVIGRSILMSVQLIEAVSNWNYAVREVEVGWGGDEFSPETPGATWESVFVFQRKASAPYRRASSSISVEP